MSAPILKRAGLVGFAAFGLLVGTSLGGCNQNTPSSFQAGGSGNPLDGGVISDGGNELELELTADGTALKSVFISGAGGTSSIDFGEPVNNVAVPREIETNGGESSLSVNRETEEIAFGLNAPLGIGRVDFSGPVPQELVVTREILLPDDRGASQSSPDDLETNCDLIVDSVDTFCDRYNTNRDASLEEVTSYAVGIAEDAIGTSIANSFIEGAVREFYDALDLLCDNFSALHDGTLDSDPVDFCASVR